MSNHEVITPLPSKALTEATSSAQAALDAAVDGADAARTVATTAETATQVAAQAAADVAADAEAVAQTAAATAATAVTAAGKADQARNAVVDAITAEAAARLTMAQSAVSVSVELAQRVETEARLLVHETELVAFAGMVAHDLKAPLRAIKGFTRILATQLEHTPGGVDAACTASIGKILAAVTRMGGLIEALLTYATARDRPLQREPLDLLTLVNHVIADYTNEQQASGSSAPEPTIDIDIDELPYVHADPVMCRQVLDNLIGNALKYRPQDQPANFLIRASAEAEDMVLVEIVDHGIGIPAEQHPKLFTPFHRAHAGYPGNGLGLAICQRIIERHGGTIGVSDTPGGGSTFRFTLASITDGSLGGTVRFPV